MTTSIKEKPIHVVGQPTLQPKNRIQFHVPPEPNGHSLEERKKIRFYLLSETDDSSLFDFIAKVVDENSKFEDFIFTSEFEAAHLVLLNVVTEDWGLKTAKKIRAAPEQFLKPMMLISDQPYDRIAELMDESIIWPATRSSFYDKVERLFNIAKKVDEFEAWPESLGQIGLRKILLLRYLYSRDSSTLDPVRNFQSSVGYSFPLVQTLFDVDQGNELTFLENLEEAQLLNAKLIDKINVCPFCGHSQINFRELCPNCRSMNFSEEPSIHHFQCAYVGRETEFREGIKLRCPKCSRDINHIGVDYDKPSDMLWCNDCKHNFSDPVLSCFCLACAKTYVPEDAFIKQISEYSLAQEGYRAAEEGTIPGFGLINILKKELGFYKFEVFVEYLRIEIFRCRRYKYNSTLARFNVKSVSEALDDHDIVHSRKLKSEFASVLNSTFRTTDLFTDLNDGQILVILTNTDCENGKIASRRLNDTLNNLIKRKIDLDVSLLDLATEEDRVEAILEKLR